MKLRSLYKIKIPLELRRIPAVMRDLTVVKNIEGRAEGKEELIRHARLGDHSSLRWL